jgi:hypothetical protein
VHVLMAATTLTVTVHVLMSLLEAMVLLTAGLIMLLQQQPVHSRVLTAPSTRMVPVHAQMLILVTRLWTVVV